MACVNVPAHALAPISRLMARVWGNTGENHPANMLRDQKVSFSKPKVVESQAEAVSQPAAGETDKTEKLALRRPKEVRIDVTTTVPTDLYWSLLRAGERAKNGGQHRLKEYRSSRVPGQESPRPHLVRTN
mmetsp:Transcript_77523/g.136747  ORF Transcript_77523/g.136747 Transcript_77523/m.136747 type:complete len:130 (-) Transcript_77523:241-630(-)